MQPEYEPRHRRRPTTTARARTLRKESSIPERILWGILRGRRLGGLKFRRQHPVGRFFPDYACVAARLLIELDGESHTGRGEHDDARTAYLNQMGYRVIRVTVDDLLKHSDAVAEYIAREAGLDW